MPISPKTAMTVVPFCAELPNGNHGEPWALFLSYLSLLTSLTKERRKQGHWINIHSNKLRSLMGGKYKDHISDMKNAGIIDVNDRYSTGMLEGISPFSKSYRLSDQLRTGKFVQFELFRKPSIRKTISGRDPDPKNLGPAGMHYRQSFDRFSIDPVAKFDEVANDAYWDQWTISRWINRYEFAIRCNKRRYHCLATQLPRSLRKHLRVDTSQFLSIVDVSACQPLLLGIQTAINTTSTFPLLSYGAQISVPHALDRDVRLWIELCEQRAIYDYFFDAIKSYVGPTSIRFQNSLGRMVSLDLRNASQNSFKRSVLITLFDKTEVMMQSPIFKIIQSDFPTIANFVLRAKQHGHARLACLLQNFEASIMIDKVGETLMEHHASEAVQPIHDALLVRNEFAETAASIIQSHFSAMGVNAKMKVDDLEQTIENQQLALA